MNYHKKLKQYQQKGLTKDLINKFSILYGDKYLFSGTFQIIPYLYQLNNTLDILLALLRLICGNLMECQKKIRKI